MLLAMSPDAMPAMAADVTVGVIVVILVVWALRKGIKR